MFKKIWNLFFEKTYFISLMYPDQEDEWQYANHVVCYRKITPENFLGLIANLKESNEYKDVMIMCIVRL